MSNSIAPGSSADVNVRVTALTTNPNVPAQYKTVILKKNIVNGVNTLTQEMMSATTTKYVVKYDYVLGEDITVPANCVLEFDGGSFENGSGNNYTMTLNNTTFEGENIVFTNIALSGTITNKTIKLSWVGGSISNMLSINPSGHTIAFDMNITADATIEYNDKNNIIFDGCNNTITVGENMILFKPVGQCKDVEIKNFIFEGTTTSSFFYPNSGWDYVHENIHIHHNQLNTCFAGISLNGDLLGEYRNCSVHDNIIKMNRANNNQIGHYGIHVANANYTNIYNNFVSGCGRHAMYVAWGHDINIFNNVFKDNDIGVEHTTPTMLITRKSENVNVYGNKFLDNEACNIMIEHGAPEYDDEEQTIENRRTKGNLRNIDIHDNIIQNDTRQLWFVVMVGYYPQTDYTYFEENIKIHDNIIKSKAGCSVNFNLTSGKNIEIINNQITWEDSEDFETLFASNVVFQFRQDPTLQALAQDILQDFTIKNNILDGPNKISFSYYPFFMENLRADACFTKGLIKDNVMRGLFEITEHTYVKSNINPTVFPLSYDLWLKKFTTSLRPNLTSNTPLYEYYDTTLGKPIWWNGTSWIDATGTPV